MSWLLVALFLPLFPLGMVFNTIFQRVKTAWVRALLLLVWPLAGLGVMQLMPFTVSTGMAMWALFSAALYGFRAVAVKELGVWTGFLATSSWSLIWVALAAGIKPEGLVMHALAFSFPLMLLVFLIAELERRYESAYAGVVSGMAQMHPRLSGILVVTLLASIASPLFPAFFAMLNSITHAAKELPIAAFGVAAVWLLWSWSGMKLLQDLIIGSGRRTAHHDIARGMTTIYTLSLVVLVAGGLTFSGDVL